MGKNRNPVTDFPEIFVTIRPIQICCKDLEFLHIDFLKFFKANFFFFS